jgi:N-acetylmuramoyl-L-alanine amidase
MKPFYKISDETLMGFNGIPFGKWKEENFFEDPDLILEPLPHPMGEVCPSCESERELTDLILGYELNRKLTLNVAHCSGTRINATVEGILKYWKDTLKWRDPGYHVIVDYWGKWTFLHDFNRPSNGVRGHNLQAIHICTIGGLDANGKAADTRSEGQKNVLKTWFTAWNVKMNGNKINNEGHRAFANKACPCYDVKPWLKSVGVN